MYSINVKGWVHILLPLYAVIKHTQIKGHGFRFIFWGVLWKVTPFWNSYSDSLSVLNSTIVSSVWNSVYIYNRYYNSNLSSFNRVSGGHCSCIVHYKQSLQTYLDAWSVMMVESMLMHTLWYHSLQVYQACSRAYDMSSTVGPTVRIACASGFSWMIV